MIPKKIHYCWFGGNPLPKSAQNYIETWKKYCSDYEIIEWNESNFDINGNQYVKEAYENKKFAFVSDYVRLYAMYNYGGVYMDTDVEVLRSLDEFLHHQAFSGFETPDYIPTGIMACEKGFELFGEFLDYYANRSFYKPNGSLDMRTNVETMTEIVDKYGLVKDGSYQEINGFALYPREIFCPYNVARGKVERMPESATIHWFEKSWMSPGMKLRVKVTSFIRKVFGHNSMKWFKGK